MKKIILFVVLTLIGCKPKIEDGQLVQASKEFDSIRNEIIQSVKDGKTPSFSIAVLQKGKIIWQESFERVDNSTVSISSNDQFPIASMTKSMTAAVVLKLVERGQISLEDDISDYLPETFTNFANNSIRIKELLSMTAGIPHGGFSFKSKSALASSSNSKLINLYGMTVFPAGIYEYSNFSYGLLELVVEKVSQKPYEHVLKEMLFDPLGMKNSFLTANLDNRLQKRSPLNDSVFSSTFYPAGAAGVYSTLSDIVRYARLHLNELDEAILSRESLRKLHYYKINPSTIYTLGWGSIALDSNVSMLISDGSFRHSANSNMTIVPEHNLAVICLANRDYESFADMMAIKTVDHLIPGFAEKAINKLSEYRSINSQKLSMDRTHFRKWIGSIKYAKGETPIQLMYKLDSLYMSTNKSNWQTIKNAKLDNQSVIRGNVSLSLLNPITERVEMSTGSINLLISKAKLEGYFLANFDHKDATFLDLPFFISAIGDK